MAIVTISRGAFSGGKVLAERVASVLGYRCIDREVLIEASRRYGISEARYTEILETQPHWWEKWREGLRLYRITLQAAMCEIARDGKLVYHGHGGHELLPEIRHVLKVHLTAPIEFRLAQVMAREGLDKESARDYIERVDKARTRRLKDLFGADWHDPSRYDLVLNISRMTLESAARLIVETAQREEFQSNQESEQALEDLTLTARVEAALIISRATRNLNLKTRAARGEVHLWGVLADPGLEETIVGIVEKVPGVKRVVAKLEALPMDSLYH